MKSEAKIVPFAFGGAGYSLEDFSDGNLQFPFGAGIHFRVSPYAFVKLQAEYRKSLDDNRDNIHFGLGYVYLLHKSENQPVKTMPEAPSNDNDKDGVANDIDRCPDDPGPAAALGCPDKDNDGIADTEDLCTEDQGTFSTGGCPDYDKDGVADKDDECPNEAGQWNGCPDADFDGVPDKDDKCPTEAGIADNMGCPEMKDSDQDGVPDEKDDCPTAAGALAGCPDSDGDGVADKDDRGPATAGTVSNNGCPESKDSDGDGLLDENDPCPNEAGPLKGCPDADLDGIADKDDRCPNQKGTIKNNGCPDAPAAPAPTFTVSDKDGDGIADKSDPCPDKAGKFNGCPDSDGDGLADNLDKCPDEAGNSSNSGCPEVKKEIKDRLAYAAQAVQFEAGKAILKSQSYAILDEIVQIMRENTAYTLSISGHTDDVGDDESNFKLSQERAKACYDYLLFRGIKSERLRHAGFGEARPISDNKTAEGRELNRRVEFELTIE
ncbi:MAG: thrombospondin type 3 repeat-containing protein [Saprospiraceae bacterium]|nr:thrombospondin type 3 repeat-containing protein [Saprospiraceae bacterium]